MFQEYYNEGDAPIEAKYVFPLDDSAAGKYLWESDVSSIEMWVYIWHECAFLYKSVNFAYYSCIEHILFIKVSQLHCSTEHM